MQLINYRIYYYQKTFLNSEKNYFYVFQINLLRLYLIVNSEITFTNLYLRI